KPACLKCPEQHLTKDCKQTKETPAKCINCGSDHPANATICKEYLKRLSAIETKSNYTRSNVNQDKTSRSLPVPDTNSIKLASNVHIVAVYSSPRIIYNSKELDILLNIGDKVMLVGDLNARHGTWNCHVSNLRGRILYNYSLNNNCSIMFPDEPTHYLENGTTPTTIDIALNKNAANVSQIHTLNELSSDHNPIAFNIGAQIKTINNKLAFDYDRADWNKFRQILNKNIKLTPNITTTEEIEQEVQRYTNIIKNKRCSPKPHLGQNKREKQVMETMATNKELSIQKTINK
ncbi:RNA-directed DNA polymerase from mobile element jockey, partial [Habropoda laboriosa]